MRASILIASAAMAVLLPATPVRAGGCFVGATPCGSAEQMARTIARCLAEPAACGTLERPGAAPADAPVTAAAPRPAPPAREVAVLAIALPLDAAVRDLRDRLPDRPEAIERRLGLRRPAGPVADLRAGVPSADEILQALLPR